jgi:hypothetical protein
VILPVSLDLRRGCDQCVNQAKTCGDGADTAIVAIVRIVRAGAEIQAVGYRSGEEGCPSPAPGLGGFQAFHHERIQFPALKVGLGECLGQGGGQHQEAGHQQLAVAYSGFHSGGDPVWVLVTSLRGHSIVNGHVSGVIQY